MMPDQAPKCVCGTKDWRPRGVNISPNLISQTFTCNACHRPAIYINSGVSSAFIISAEITDNFQREVIVWINEVLLLVHRDVDDRLTKARKTIEAEALINFYESEGLTEETKMDELDPGQKERFKHMCTSLYAESRWQCPAGFEKQETPPMIPTSIKAFLPLEGNEWQMIDNAATVDMTVPVDPIRRNHDKYFGQVFEELEAVFGPIEKTEIENEYHSAKNQPWYEFTIGDRTFTVGPRKRVVSIEVKDPGGIWTELIRQTAKRDDTTYYANGGWQSDVPKAEEIVIHAWNMKKVVEYITILSLPSIVTQA